MSTRNPVPERKNCINGQFVGSARQFTKFSPVDGTQVAIVHEADRDMVDQAVKDARAALKGAWGRRRLQEPV